MAVTYGTRSTSSTNTANRPSSTADGDLLILQAANRDTAVSLVRPDSSWTPVINTKLSSGAHRQITTWWKIASSEPASYTVTGSTTTQVIRITGHHPTSPIQECTAYSATNTGNTTISGKTIDNDGSLAIIFGIINGGTLNPSAPTADWTDTGATPYARIWRRSYDYTTSAGVTWNVGTSSYELVHWTTVAPSIAALVEPPTMTATAAAVAPTITAVRNASTTVVASTATAAALAPTLVAVRNATTTAALATGTAAALAPTAIGGVLQLTPTLTATSAALTPNVTGGAGLPIVDAPTATGLATLLAPTTTGGAIKSTVPATATVLFSTPTIVGGAAVAAALSDATSAFLTPGVRISATITIPTSEATMTTFAATASGAATLVPLQGVVTAAAVVPEVGIDRRAGAFLGNRVSVSTRTTGVGVTARPQPTGGVVTESHDAHFTRRATPTTDATTRRVTGSHEERT